MKNKNTKIYEPKDSEDFMNPRQVEYFKNLLLEWKKEILRESSNTIDNLKEESSNKPDNADRASIESERSLELRTRDRERKLINKIAGSLEQIKQDDYGYCYACGIEIGVKRLEARPTATHCIDCKTLDEIKEKQLGG